MYNFTRGQINSELRAEIIVLSPERLTLKQIIS